MSKYNWLEKRTLRSVDQLRLWSENPRLDPEERHISITDIVLDLLSDPPENTAFKALVSSIAEEGFIPADPIVVWQQKSNQKYYVAEGNRRILALKLLRNPQRAPKSIRSFIRKKSELIDKRTIAKVGVNVAPSLRECEWYLNQRHVSGNLVQFWSRHQQQRWVASLYDNYDGDIEAVINATKMKKSQLVSFLRILKIRDMALDRRILDHLSPSEKEKVRSHRLPMTILERWFDNGVVRERWGLVFDEEFISLRCVENSFYEAYCVFIQLVLQRDEPDIPLRINTRTITTNLNGILEYLPQVKLLSSEYASAESVDEGADSEGNETGTGGEGVPGNKKKPVAPTPEYKNPDRSRMVVKDTGLTTTNYKLNALFEEMKLIPPKKYKNSLAGALRIFLDLGVLQYIYDQKIDTEIKRHYSLDLKDITLRKRLEFLKKNSLKGNKGAAVIGKLLVSDNQYSLDVLNSYVHGNQTHHTSLQFLNGFWDFLFPLFEDLMDIQEL